MNSFLQFVNEIIEQELQEANAISNGNVVGYSLPLGMDPKPGHKMLWSGDEEKENKVGDALRKASKNNS